MPWMVVRGLAIDLNNKQDSPEGACSILEGLISHKGTTPSKAVVNKLRDNLRTLRRNLKWEELKRVSGDVPKGISLVSELLEGADPDERAALLQLKRGLTQKRNTKVGKWAFWGPAAAGFAGFLIYDANKKPSYTPRPSPTATFAPSGSSPTSSPSSSASSQFTERLPAPGTDRVLGRREVRYCIFQGGRLDIVNGGGIMHHARRPGGPVAAAQNCATHGPLLVVARGRRCTAWSSMRRFDWRLSTRV